MASEAQGEETGLVFHPMEQFVVKPLFGGDTVMWYTPTNVTLWMALTVLAVFALLVLGTSRRAMIPSRMQSVGELAYGFIYRMIEDVAGKDGVKYFPYIMTLFMFIVFSINARTGRSTKGAELIQNTPKKPNPCLTNPRIVTVRNTAMANTPVTAIWDVVVNAIGSRPRKFENTINMNKVMIYGKYLTPSLPATSSIIR